MHECPRVCINSGRAGTAPVSQHWALRVARAAFRVSRAACHVSQATPAQGLCVPPSGEASFPSMICTRADTRPVGASTHAGRPPRPVTCHLSHVTA